MLEDIIADFPSWLRREMTKAHISRKRLADKLGVYVRTVDWWRGGQGFPRADRFAQMLRMFGYDVVKKP